MDYLLSDYARHNLDKFTQSQLEDYDVLLDQSDNDIYMWLTSEISPPEDINQYIVFDIINFNKFRYVA